jgi:hypothetical protein
MSKDTDYLNMSDEEMRNSAPPPEDVVEDKLVAESADTETVEDTEEVADSESTTEADADDDAPGAAEKVDAEGEDKQEEKKVPDKVKEPVETKDKEEIKEPPAVDYEAEYKRLIAPFKANGRDVDVKSVDDAIALMQMGANYNKKMAALKPNLKLMKLLQNNNLLSEEKLAYLIDLGNKDPNAINKLVKESGIDPMDIDAAKASEYKPKIHTVDDREIDLDTVLDELQDSPSYNRTLEIVSQKWDGASKQVVAGMPELLRVINSHVESGIYDLISKEVEGERMFGRLKGLSDIDAYRQVGDAMQLKGRFNNLGRTQNKAAPEVVVQPKPKKVEDESLKDKRRAASSTKPVVTAAAAKDFNPLSLSDAEFSKLSDPRFR